MSLGTIDILCDNTSATNISKNPVQHSRTKQIDIQHHFIRDNVEKDFIKLGHCRTENQVTDIFTKALDKKPYENIRILLGMIIMN